MRVVFADTGYFVAIINPRDSLHQTAMAVSQQLGQVSIVTSEMVLVEVLNRFSGMGGHLRAVAAKIVNEITADGIIQVVPQNEAVGLQKAFEERWVPKYGPQCAKRMFMTHSVGSIIGFWINWMKKNLNALKFFAS